MSLRLLFVLTALLLTDYVVGLLYGVWSEGFDKEKCIKGAQKYFLIFIGYGALALTAYLSAMRLPEMEYLSGLLLEPIARYFIKLLDRLKELMTGNAAKAGTSPINEKTQETVVTVEAVAPTPVPVESAAEPKKPVAEEVKKPVAETRKSTTAETKKSATAPKKPVAEARKSTTAETKKAVTGTKKPAAKRTQTAK